MASKGISAVAMKAKKDTWLNDKSNVQFHESEHEEVYEEDPNPESFDCLDPKYKPYSTWRPKNNDEIGSSQMTIWLRGTEQITLIGEFDLYVLKGAAEVSGFVATPSEKPYTIFAPSVEALPSIHSYWANSSTQIQLRSRPHPMKEVQPLFLSFGNMWSMGSEEAEVDQEDDSSEIPRTFNYISDTGLSSVTQKLVYRARYPQSWLEFANSVISEYQKGDPAPEILLCGQHLTGKSTCARFLTNKLLSKQANSKSSPDVLEDAPVSSVFWLDLDPNKPEFSPPGQISLIHVKTPLIGPSFTHNSCQHLEAYEIIRAHCVTDQTLDGPETFFWDAVQDLYSQYIHRSTLFRQSPLLVNCPGYKPSDRFGSDLMKQLLLRVPYTKLGFLGEIKLLGKLEESERSLLRLKGNSGIRMELEKAPDHVKTWNLPRHDLMQLQAMTYFHAISPGPTYLWSSASLLSLPKLTLSYAWPDIDFLGIVTVKCHPPDYKLVQNETFLLKSCVGICLLEDALAAKSAATERFHPGSDKVPYLTNIHRLKPYRPPVSVSSLIGWGYVKDINKEKQVVDLVTPLSEEIKFQLLQRPRTKYPRIALIRTATSIPDWALHEEPAKNMPIPRGSGFAKGWKRKSRRPKAEIYKKQKVEP